MNLDEAIIEANILAEESKKLAKLLDDASYTSGVYNKEEKIKIISVAGDIFVDVDYYDSFVNFYNDNYADALNQINKVIKWDTKGRHKDAIELKKNY